MNKLTKIVATVSDMRCEQDFIADLLKAGANAVRLNTAHQGHADTLKVVNNVRAVDPTIPLLLDTKGPEIRTTKKSEDIFVKSGDTIVVKGNPDELSSPECVYVTYEGFVNDVAVGTKILIDDGDVGLTVKEKKGDSLICSVDNDGEIGGKKSVNVPGVSIKLPSISKKDHDYILFAIEHKLDFIAHSFVRNKEDVKAIQDILDAHNSQCKIIAKIENHEGVENLDEILEVVYGIMVARGDMGIEIPAERIPAIQKMMIEKCRAARKPVITATQMLHTMIEKPRPTRAEVSDVANAVYDGTDCLMLSGETAKGDYPIEAVTIMAKIARETEQQLPKWRNAQAPSNANPVASFLASSAVEASKQLDLKGIVIDTSTGKTARYLSSHRGSVPVYAWCYDEQVTRLLAISYGVQAMTLGTSERPQDFVSQTVTKLTEAKTLAEDDQVLVLAGSFGPAQGASFIEIGTAANLKTKK